MSGEVLLRTVFIIVGILLTIVVIGLLYLSIAYMKNRRERSKVKNNREMHNKLLSYIKENEDNEFDYAFVSRKLNLSYKEIYKYLNFLSEADEIVAQQKHLRKPILLSDNDIENFYWKVYIRSDKHPASKLGTLYSSNEESDIAL